MEISWGYFSVLLAYLVFILIIGLRVGRDQTASSYIIADRTINHLYGAGTFYATYNSSATMLGLLGYATLFGAAVYSTFYFGIAVGWITLVLLAARMRSLQMDTVPQFFEMRFNSSLLRAMVALVIVTSFLFSIMTQLVASGILVQNLVGLPIAWGIVLIGGVLAAYTVIGGLRAVVRTDLIQAGLIIVGVLAGFFAVLQHAGPQMFQVQAHQMSIIGGGASDTLHALGYFIAFWGGVAAQPYYLHRFNAVKDIYTARNMIGSGVAVSGVGYLLIAFMAIGLSHILPQDRLGDHALPYFAMNVATGILGPIIIISLVAAIQSTLDSALHLAGVFTSEDVIGYFKKDRSDNERLATAQRITAIVAVIGIIGAIYFTTIQGAFLMSLVNVWAGVLAAALMVPLLLGLFWKRFNTAGAVAAVAGGALTYVFVALHPGLTINAAMPGIIVSLVLGVVCTLLTPAPDQSILQRFFSPAQRASGQSVEAEA